MKPTLKRLAFVSLAALLGSAAIAVAWNNSGGEVNRLLGGEAPPVAEVPPSAFTWVVEPFVLDGDVEVLLLRVGLSKEGLAAAGISSGELQTLLSSASSSLAAEGLTLPQGVTSAPAQLAVHDAAVSEAREQRDQLKRKVQSGLATQQEVAELQQAKNDYDSAVAARDAFLESIRTALCALAPEGDRSAVSAASANYATWKHLPAKYLTVERSQAEWVSLRKALASKRSFESMGEAVPEAATTLLANMDSSQAVAAAAACCASEGASVDATWAAIFGE